MKDEKQSTEQFIESLATEVSELIDQYGGQRKEVLEKLLLDEYLTLYFTSPASAKTSYHEAYAGGLAEHSIKVFKNLLKLNATFSFGFSYEKMIVVALLHDFGKCAISTGKEPYYLETKDDWKNKRGIQYDYNDAGIFFPTFQRTMFLLQQAKFHLDDEEYQAILLNDGMFIKANEDYSHKMCNLAFALHTADMISIL